MYTCKILRYWPILLNIDTELHRQKRLKHNQYKARQAKIQESEESIRTEYSSFFCHVGDLMEETQVDLPRVKLTWAGYKGGISEKAENAGDIKSFLMAISESQGPYAYRGLIHLLKRFCKDSEELVAKYEKELKDLLLGYKRVILPRQDCMQFKVKVDGQLSESNESDFRITLNKLFGGEAEDFLLEDIRSGCTELTYIISSIFAENLRAHIVVSEEGLRNAKILQLTLEG